LFSSLLGEDVAKSCKCERRWKKEEVIPKWLGKLL